MYNCAYLQFIIFTIGAFVTYLIFEFNNPRIDSNSNVIHQTFSRRYNTKQGIMIIIEESLVIVFGKCGQLYE